MRETEFQRLWETLKTVAATAISASAQNQLDLLWGSGSFFFKKFSLRQILKLNYIEFNSGHTFTYTCTTDCPWDLLPLIFCTVDSSPLRFDGFDQLELDGQAQMPIRIYKFINYTRLFFTAKASAGQSFSLSTRQQIQLDLYRT